MVELDPTAGFEWSRYTGLEDDFRLKGRVELVLSLNEEWKVWEDFKVFGLLNTWFIDYSHENADKESGATTARRRPTPEGGGSCGRAFLLE